MADTPVIDPRGLPELVAQTEALVEQRTQWRRSPPERLDAVGALVRVFARMAGHAVQALNRAPDVGHLAFLDLVGVRPRPPQVARAPLTFALAEGAAEAVVPARTQVGADDDDAVVFETEAPLTITAARLEHALARDPDADEWADLADLCDPSVGRPRALLAGDRPVDHALHVGCGPVLALPGLTEVVLDLEFAATLTSPDDLRALPLLWSAWDGAAWRPVAPISTAAAPLGDRHRLRVTWSPAPPVAPVDVAGRTDLWLRAALDPREIRRWWRDHVAHGQGPQLSPAALLAAIPLLRGAAVRGRILVPPRPPRAVVSDRGDLDPSRDLLPFGDHPGFGDAVLLDPGDLTDLPAGATVTLAVITCPTPPAPCAPSPALRLAWEVHTATGWRLVGESGPASSTSAPGAAFTDGTRALSATGSLQFTLPAPLVPADDTDGVCLRARILAGDYGQPAHVDAAQNPPRLVASTLGPPVLRGLTLAFAHDGAARPPTALIAIDDHVAADRAADLAAGRPAPFAVRSPDPGPALYLGFSGSLGQVPLSMYFGTCPLDPDDAERPAPPVAARVQWEYRTAAGWRPLTVDDETRELVAPGLVRLSAPPDHVASHEFGRPGWWLRVRRTSGAHRGPPRASRIVPHTVWARHATTLRETLGSGDGTLALALRSQSAPVLAGERLEVGERAGLTRPEALTLAADLSPDAAAHDDGPFGWSLWVRWREVPDLRGASQGDRHYVLDRARGLLRTGDGVRGRAVPQGRANVRITYEVGGGAQGNRRAGALTALKASLAAVAAVTNWDPATGGADAEELPAMAARGAADLRNRGRAVAACDLEDLARTAAPDVARVLAIPPRVDPIAAAVEFDSPPGTDGRVQLAVIPEATAAASARAGLVRVVVVARGREPRPAPSAGLLERVAAHLRARCPPGMRLEVTGPRWLEVRVTCGLVAASQAHAVGLVAAARAALDAFLHPLTGGLQGTGWPFGRVPRRSDVNRVLAAVPGVDHLRNLAVVCDPPPPPPSDDLSDEEMAALARLMISPGPHALTLAGVAGEAP